MIFLYTETEIIESLQTIFPYSFLIELLSENVSVGFAFATSLQSKASQLQENGFKKRRKKERIKGKDIKMSRES